ncbi:hypothetical protein BTS2_3943 [Bacillus sp. TS-2]|nr:hypothetical protein BTS2_3943 [Bacillus sp. TS-2]
MIILHKILIINLLIFLTIVTTLSTIILFFCYNKVSNNSIGKKVENLRRQFITLEELIEKNKENLLNDPEALSEIEKRIDERNEQTYKDNK